MAEEDHASVGDELDGEIDAALLEGLLSHEKAIAVADAIEADIGNAGPLGRYLGEKRVAALAAIRALPDLDLDDKVNLRICQTAIRAFLDVMLWIGRELTAAEHGADVIRRELVNKDEAD